MKLACRTLVVASFSALALEHSAAAQCALEDLGTLGGTYTIAQAVSADGLVVVGRSTFRAFRWTAATGMQDLGVPGVAEAVATSADGAVVVGSMSQRAFRWTAATGAVDLGHLGGGTTTLGGAVNHFGCLSTDGAVIVGESSDASGNPRAFRWTAATGMVDLGTLGGGAAAAAAVNADGSVVVGWSQLAGGAVHAFRWTSAGGMQDLGTMLGNAHATHVTPDGLVVAGSGGDVFGTSYTFRWTAAGGMQMTSGPIGPVTSRVVGLSADGTVVVGTEADGSGNAFRWTTTGGYQAIYALGQTVTDVGGISADARTWAGSVEYSSPTLRHALRFSDFGAAPFDLGQAGRSSRATAISADGRVVVGLMEVAPNVYHPFRYDAGTVGQSYCRTYTNSRGCWGDLEASGSDVVAQNNLQLTARALPPNAFGYFLASRTSGSSFVPGSSGYLCLGGTIGRFNQPGQILNSGASGAFTLPVDLNALPTPTGPVAASPGETWHFQAWHRDVTFGGPTSNFSDGVRVLLR